MPLVPIHSLDDPRLAPYHDLPNGERARRSPHLIAEGRLLVERLLASRVPTESLLVSQRWAEEYAARWPDLPVYVANHEQMQSLVGYSFHLGVMACGRRPPRLPIEAVLSALADGGPADATFVACPDLHNRENLGALLRNAAAFQVQAVLLGPGCVDPFSRRVLRVSMGAALCVPILQSLDLAADLRRLRDEGGVELAATVLAPDAELLDEAARPDRLALLFGSEYEGLSPDWVQLCARRLTIPMGDAVDSLNVAVAAGVFLHHFTRRRRSGKSR